MKNIKKFAPILAMLAVTVGCKKDYLETRPSNGVLQDVVLGSPATLNSALGGIYGSLFAFGPNGNTGHDNYGQKSLDLAMDLMGTDMVVHSQGYGWYNTNYTYNNWNNPTSTARNPDQFWFYYYNIIKNSNQILAVIDKSTATQTEKETIKGQALGLRAYAYYFLINMFQQTYKGNETKPGVPLYTETAIVATRGKVQDVYDRIIADLTLAETLLTGKTFTDKTYMDVRVVQGFRARTALLMEDWATAATYANKARQGYTLATPPVYLASSGFSSVANPEWMWGSLIPAASATIYASFYSHMDIATNGYAALGGQKKITKALYDQIQAGDARKNAFTAPPGLSTTDVAYNQKKHRVPVPGSWAADYLYMRASEMYLIEAEALARQNQDAGAKTVLETVIKARFPAYSAAAFSGTTLLNEILLQRRIELWGEGFSLIDIKRLKNGLNRPTGAGNHGSPSLDPVIYTLPAGDARFVSKIPQREMDSNTSLTAADQNP